MYLDGEKEAEITIDWYLPAETRRVSIWKENSAYWPIDGIISEVRIYDRELSASEAWYISNNSIVK